MKIITEFIKNLGQNIHAQTMSIIWMIGSKLEARRKKKAEKKYQKALKKFSFVLSPTEVFDRLVIFNGGIYRIQFEKDGFLVRDELTDTGIEDPLLIVQLLNEIKPK